MGFTRETEDLLLKELKKIIMSTRAQIRFATREDGVSFSEHPEKINAQFYVHSDGYPEGLGIDIALSIIYDGIGFKSEIEELHTKHGDLDYIYYVWQVSGKTTWISIFKTNTFSDEEEECIFVGEPQKLIDKYDR
tara:strand:+ start:116 stop:520 length:405 start_codon:yes stop_codon:yes gene_type:complete